jgi:peptidoglycan/LPS O-acetylase OafA/YrhL
MNSRPATYYYPQLDGLRGIAFLCVFFLHAFRPHFSTHLLGEYFQFLYSCLALSIDTFFVYSSFLLTLLGIREYEKNGDFSFVNFFLRRTFRIWPLYYFLMLVCFVIVPFVAKQSNIDITLPPAQYYLFFVSNYYLGGQIFMLQFLWTLSVEEQFYLVWGIVLMKFQKYFKLVITVFVTVSIGFTIYSTLSHLPNFNNTLSYLFDFSAGALAAIALHKKSKVVAFFQNITKIQSYIFIIVIPIVISFSFFIIIREARGIYQSLFQDVYRYFFVVYITLLIIEQLVNEKTILKLGKSKILVYTGKICYGMYCFHGVVLTLGFYMIAKLPFMKYHLLNAFLLLGITYLVASLSYQYLEKPFLKLKDKLRRV